MAIGGMDHTVFPPPPRTAFPEPGTRRAITTRRIPGGAPPATDWDPVLGMGGGAQMISTLQGNMHLGRPHFRKGSCSAPEMQTQRLQRLRHSRPARPPDGIRGWGIFNLGRLDRVTNGRRGRL